MISTEGRTMLVYIKVNGSRITSVLCRQVEASNKPRKQKRKKARTQECKNRESYKATRERKGINQKGTQIQKEIQTGRYLRQQRTSTTRKRTYPSVAEHSRERDIDKEMNE